MKNIIIFTTFILINTIAFSQENWVYSPSFGVNMVPIQESANSGTTFKGGLSFAFTASNSLNEHISFDYGLSFNQRYATYSTSSQSSEIYDLINLDTNLLGQIGLNSIDLNVYENLKGITTYWTVDIPITMTYNTKSGIFFFGGGYVNYLISVKNKEETQTHIPVFEFLNPADLVNDPLLLSLIPQNSTVTTTNESSKELNDLNFGVTLGIGYQTEKWMIKMGYQYGLRDIRSDDMKMKIPNQQAFTLSVGYIFKDLFVSSKEKPIYDLDVIE